MNATWQWSGDRIRHGSQMVHINAREQQFMHTLEIAKEVTFPTSFSYSRFIIIYPVP